MNLYLKPNLPSKKSVHHRSLSRLLSVKVDSDISLHIRKPSKIYESRSLKNNDTTYQKTSVICTNEPKHLLLQKNTSLNSDIESRSLTSSNFFRQNTVKYMTPARYLIRNRVKKSLDNLNSLSIKFGFSPQSSYPIYLAIKQAEGDTSKSHTKNKFSPESEEYSPRSCKKYNKIYHQRRMISNKNESSKIMTISDLLYKPNDIRTISSSNQNSNKYYKNTSQLTDGTGINSSSIQSVTNSVSHLNPKRKPHPPIRNRLLGEVREMYSSVLYSTDSGSLQNAKLIKKSKVIEYKTKGIRSLSRGSSNVDKRKKRVNLSQGPIDDSKDNSDIIKSNSENLKQQLNIYNKYYDDYLVTPGVKFSSLQDLRIKLLTRPKTYLDIHDNIELDPSKDHNITRLTKFPIPTAFKPVESASTPTKASKEDPKSISQLDQKLEIMKIETDTRALTAEKQRVLKRGHHNRYNYLKKLFRDENCEDFESLLIKRPSLALARDEVLETPLHWAAKRGLKQFVELICQFNPDYHTVDIVGRTPLELAIRCGHHEIVEILKIKQMTKS